MNYVESIDCLASLGQEVRGVKFDLANIRRILEVLGHPERGYPSVIVAGTNGKGSTSAMLSSILTCAGYRTGLYTSPHLVRVNERIRVDGSEVDDEHFAFAFTEVDRAISSLRASGLLAERPSFFEFLTATGFVHFARAPVDFAVLEVGMGGRLDATNAAQPELAVITNVELDHTEYLGSTHGSIAAEKAGVMRPGRPVISGVTHPEAVEVIRRRAEDLGAELIELGALTRVDNLRSDQGRSHFDLALNGTRFSSVRAPLAGRFQVDNVSAAVAAAWKLRERGWNVSEAAIVEGLARARWPGRLEVCGERPLTLLDGAHNPAAARAVAGFVSTELAGKPLALVYASMRDKAIEAIADLLFPLASEVYLTRTGQTRAATPEEILDRARKRPARLRIEPDPIKAFEAARQNTPAEGVVLVAGSLFLVGAIKGALGERPLG